jgi:hypothetical protein
MRAVLPPPGVTLIAFLLSYGSRALLEALTWMARPASVTDFSFLHVFLEAEPTQWSFAVVLGFAAAAYGIWRVLGRHPVVRTRYREWLLRTPWRWQDPLPAGPLLPAWQDLVVLAVLTVPAIGWPILSIFVPALTALVSYSLIALFVAAFSRKLPLECFAGLWSAAAMLYFRDTPPAVALGAAVLLASAWRAAAADLRKLTDEEEPFTSGFLIPSAIEQHGPLGWPYDVLTPHPLQQHSTGLLLAMAITVGLVLAAIRPVKDMLDFEVEHFVVLAGGAIAFTRFVLLSTLAIPRLSVARRLRFGRLVSLRADSLALSSLAIALVGYLLPSVVLQMPTTGTNQFALAITILLALAFCLPSSRETWRLTSHARLPRNKNRANRPRRLKHASA